MQNAVSSVVIFWARIIIKAKQVEIRKSNIGFSNIIFIEYKTRFALKKADKKDFNYVFVKQKLDTGYKNIRTVIKI